MFEFRPQTGRVTIARVMLAILFAGFAGCSDFSGPTAVPPSGVVPPQVASMTMTSGDYQLALAGTTLLNPLKVRLLDTSRKPVEGVTVTFTIVSGEGSIGGQEVATDATGIATSPPWTLGPVAGSQNVAARSGNHEVVFTAEACPVDACPPALLFVRQGEIHSIELITNVETQLTFGWGKNAHPAVSPDGQRIAFVRYDEWAGDDVYVMNADGSNVTRRTTGWNFSYPAWSPDGKTLAVATSARMPYWGEVYLVSAVEDGTPPVKIADDASMPAWSPDGKGIAYVSLSGDDGYHALHVANADGSEVREVVRREPHALFRPTWSSDGRRIAFSSCLDARCDVRVINVDGSTVWETNLGNAGWPAWSRDGRWIAFTIYEGPRSYRIAFVDAEHGAIPFPAVANGVDAVW